MTRAERRAAAGARRGATPATTLLGRAGVDHAVHAYAHDPATDAYGAEAVAALGAALGVEAQRVLKTLVADLDGELVVAVVAVADRLDLKALARALGGSRAAMAEPARAERATGYVVGGISPLGQRRRHRTALDVRALAHTTVLVSAGRRGLEVELAPAELVRLTDAVVAPLARDGLSRS